MPNIQLGSQDNLYYDYTPPDSESRFTFCFFSARTGDTNTWEAVIGPRLRAAGHGDHPWVRYAPAHWAVNSWSVILNDQGHQLSHIHPEAWMSAVYYVAVPEDGVGVGHGEDGWLELGQPSDQLFAKAEAPLRSIQPEPGKLVTFPSYIFHRTKPFTSTKQRISISFDIFAKL